MFVIETNSYVVNGADVDKQIEPPRQLLLAPQIRLSERTIEAIFHLKDWVNTFRK
jgi:hypothetical protein